MRRTAQPRTVARQPLIKKAAAPVQRKAGRFDRGAYAKETLELKGTIQVSDYMYVKAKSISLGTLQSTSSSAPTGSDPVIGLNAVFVADEVSITTIVETSTANNNSALIFDKDSESGVGIQSDPIIVNATPSEGMILATVGASGNANYVKVSGPTDFSGYSFAFSGATSVTSAPTLDDVEEYKASNTDNTHAQHYFLLGEANIIRKDKYEIDGVTKVVTIKAVASTTDANVIEIQATYEETVTVDGETTTTVKPYTGPIRYPFRAWDTITDSPAQGETMPTPDATKTYSYVNELEFTQPSDSTATLEQLPLVKEEITTTKPIDILADVKFDTKPVFSATAAADDKIIKRYNIADFIVAVTEGTETTYKEVPGDIWIINENITFGVVDAETNVLFNVTHSNTQSMRNTNANCTFAENKVLIENGTTDTYPYDETNKTENHFGKLSCGVLTLTGCDSVVIEGKEDKEQEKVTIDGVEHTIDYVDGMVRCEKFILGQTEPEPEP